MPIRLSELSAKTRELTLVYDGEPFTVTYHPARFTPEMASRMQDIPTSERPTMAFVEALAGVLAGWDILDDKGKPLPVSAEWVAQMPMDLLNQITNAVVEDMTPKKMSVATSNGTSSPMA